MCLTTTHISFQMYDILFHRLNNSVHFRVLFFFFGLKDLTIENSILFVLKTKPLNFDATFLCEMQLEVV